MATGEIMMIDKRNRLTTLIDISSYTSNYYTTNHEGYLDLYRTGSSNLQVRLSGSNGQAFDVYAIQGEHMSLYIKRGIGLRVISKNEGDRIGYHELF